jgi:hypothetical protein
MTARVPARSQKSSKLRKVRRCEHEAPLGRIGVLFILCIRFGFMSVLSRLFARANCYELERRLAWR